MDEKCLEQYMVNYNDDFIIRYGEYDSNAEKEGNTNRTFYMTFKDAYKKFNEMKENNKIIWRFIYSWPSRSYWRIWKRNNRLRFM